MKKLICVLLLFTMLFSFTACNSPDAPNDESTAVTDAGTDTSAQTEDKGKLIASTDGTEYIIVVGADAYSALTEVCTSIRTEVFDATGKNIFVKSDKAASSSQQYEILVGETNREESKTACEGLKQGEFCVKWVGDKLVVGAGSVTAARAGAEWLYKNYIRGMSGTSLYIPSNIDHKGSVDVGINVEKLNAGWNALVYPAADGTELQCQIYMPKNYDSTKAYPCILYMHSAGVRCSDNSHITKGEAKFLRNLESGKYANETIVIAPCCPTTAKWVPVSAWNQITYDFINTQPTAYMKAVTELFADAREQLSVDESRLYLYGMSMGGFATWDLLTRNPDMFAAAIPVAGAGDPNAVSLFDDVAIWIFHGTADEAVPYESSQKMYEALKAAGRDDIKYTSFEGAGHGIWSMTADTEGLYDWLFSQKREAAE